MFGVTIESYCLQLESKSKYENLQLILLVFEVQDCREFQYVQKVEVKCFEAVAVQRHASVTS